MNFATTFKFSSYGLIASGLFAVACTDHVDLTTAGFGLAVLVASWFVKTEALARRIPGRLLNSVALLSLLGFVADYRWFSRSGIVSMIHLVMLFAALKLFTRSTDRDYVYLYAVSFTQLLAAAALTVGMAFALNLAVYLFFAVTTLVLFEMKRSAARAQAEASLRPAVAAPGDVRAGTGILAGFRARPVLLLSAGATVLIVALAVPLFLVLPRIAMGVYRRPAGRTQMVSGFSERVELGQLGTISESDAVVMRVRLNLPPRAVPPELKWRGIALDHYDGRAWSKTDLSRGRVFPSGRFFKLEDYKQADSQLLYQTFFMQATTTDVVFASHRALAISEEIGYLQRDRAGALFTVPHPFQKIRYTAVSDPVRIDPSRIPEWALPAPKGVRDCCLAQIPSGDPRVRELARTITSGISRPYEKARAIESWLRTNVAYSLELRGTPNHPDPIAMFLFEEKRGHCEYFASALAIMLRHVGVPSRIVNGFRSGEYNRLADAWTVRQYDAHSWVEAYFSPYGWIEFDPTPTAPGRARPTLLNAAVQFFDLVGLWWSEEVVNYDIRKQFRLFYAARSAVAEWNHDVRAALARMWDRIRSGISGLPKPGSATSVLTSPTAWGALALLSLGIVAFAKRRAWSLRLFRTAQRTLGSANPERLARSFYTEALEILEAAGWKKDAAQTHLEFAESLASHPAGAPLAQLTGLYQRIRFGAARVPEAPNEFRRLLHELRDSVGTQPPLGG
jgi:protein-glutamine gamma-glutamyltransferase